MTSGTVAELQKEIDRVIDRIESLERQLVSGAWKPVVMEPMIT